jgi:hypothetical protein
MGWSADGQYLTADQWLKPNYAFTQINPLPFDVPPILTITIWRYSLNVLYVLGLYATYVALFFTFIGLYYAFLAIRKKIIATAQAKSFNNKNVAAQEYAATDDDKK